MRLHCSRVSGFTQLHQTLCIALGDVWHGCSCLAMETYSIKNSLFKVIGVIRLEPPFISVSSSWAHDTSSRLDSDHWCPRVTPLMPANTAPQILIQILVRVGGNESIEGARGGGRTRHTSRFSRQTHLNSPTITKNASKNKAIQANSPEMATWFQKVHMGHTLHLNTS